MAGTERDDHEVIVAVPAQMCGVAVDEVALD